MKTKKNPIFWILIGVLIATLLMTLVFAVNWAALLGSIQKRISNTTERVFSIDIPTTSEPASLLPSATYPLSATVQNTSGTENAYLFVKVEYGAGYSTITNPASGWVLVNGTSNVFAYSSGGSLVPVDKGDSVDFTADLVVTDDFSSITDDDMELVVTGYGISNLISRSDPSQGWEDYENGGNAEMIAEMDS